MSFTGAGRIMRLLLIALYLLCGYGVLFTGGESSGSPGVQFGGGEPAGYADIPKLETPSPPGGATFPPLAGRADIPKLETPSPPGGATFPPLGGRADIPKLETPSPPGGATFPPLGGRADIPKLETPSPPGGATFPPLAGRADIPKLETPSPPVGATFPPLGGRADIPKLETPSPPGGATFPPLGGRADIPKLETPSPPGGATFPPLAGRADIPKLETPSPPGGATLPPLPPLGGRAALRGTTKVSATFDCVVQQPRSSTLPSSVHQLRPSDIKVVGAMGDSFSAGVGANAKIITRELVQNRGIAWSGGGEGTLSEHITMPNILKKYNSDLWGYATGDGDQNNVRAHFNVAVSGSKSGELLSQARDLVNRLKTDPNVDFINDWKIITIFDGNNDLCDYCKDTERYSTGQFYNNIVDALDVLHGELPRTLVNLVETANMQIMKELNKGPICASLHYFECVCAAFPKDKKSELELEKVSRQYQDAVEAIAMSGRYDTRRDFTVVRQPLFHNSTLPFKKDGEIDMSYFSPDCFHLSAKGHEVAAITLWNNMFNPMKKKQSLGWFDEYHITCPSEDHPFIYTNFNSNPESPLDPAAREQVQDGISSKMLIITGVVGGVGVVVVVIGSVLLIGVVKRLRKRNLYVQIPTS